MNLQLINSIDISELLLNRDVDLLEEVLKYVMDG
jgi:hypothetical protein